MNIEQCWMRFLKAQELMEQGHWPEAHHLFSEVLTYLPTHIQSAAHGCELKPCQLVCLLSGLRDASIMQSELYNRMAWGSIKTLFLPSTTPMLCSNLWHLSKVNSFNVCTPC